MLKLNRVVLIAAIMASTIGASAEAQAAGPFPFIPPHAPGVGMVAPVPIGPGAGRLAAAAAGTVAGGAAIGAVSEREYDRQGQLEPWSSGWYRYCSHRYRTFDARTGTVLGSDGYRHFCSPS